MKAIFSRRTEPKGLAKLVRASRPTMLDNPTVKPSNPAAISGTPSSTANGMSSPIVPMTAMVNRMPANPICQNAGVRTTSDTCLRGSPISTLGGWRMTSSPNTRIAAAMTASQRMPARQPYSRSSHWANGI